MYINSSDIILSVNRKIYYKNELKVIVAKFIANYNLFYIIHDRNETFFLQSKNYYIDEAHVLKKESNEIEENWMELN